MTSDEAATLTIHDIAARLTELGVPMTARTVADRVRDETFPHVRIGKPPEPGRRDVRRVRFTDEQADSIAESVTAGWSEHIPAKSGCAS